MLRYIQNFRAKIYIYIRTKIRKLKKYLRNFFELNPINVNADLKANSNMTLKARIVKKERRKLSLLYHLFVFFFFFFFFFMMLLMKINIYLFMNFINGGKIINFYFYNFIFNFDVYNNFM